MQNSVQYLQSINFHQLTLPQKIELKNKGRPIPHCHCIRKNHQAEVDHTFANSIVVCMIKLHGSVNAI